MDMNFKKILKILEEIHNNAPTNRFGSVLQVSLDTYKNNKNIDLNEKSSKEILKALEEFKIRTKKQRGD